MKKLTLRFTILTAAFLWSSAALAGHPPKYVILMIGDGMGPAQVDIADRYQRAKTGEGLHLNTLPFSGYMSTSAANNPITDSAAGATALACGKKGDNGVLSMGLATVAEHAKKSGKKVGIISSVAIDHATPAAFYAHQPSRGNYYEIAASLPKSDFDFFAGETFIGSKKAKGRPDLIEHCKKAGYQVVTQNADILALKPSKEKVIILADLPPVIDLSDDDLSLVDLTKKGLELLDNPNGFFLMIEGGKIDWAGHSNDLATNLKETLNFDEAVAVVLNFYAAHKEETLVVITADHETGGLEINDCGIFDYEEIDRQKTSGSVLSQKVSDWKQSGISFKDALKFIEAEFGLGQLSESERAQLEEAYDAFMGNYTEADTADFIKEMYGNKHPISTACQQIITARCRAAWLSYGHTATDVPLRAIGVQAKRFNGNKDNAEVGKALISIYHP